MSLKQEIETWVSALAAYDAHEFDGAIKCFQQICDTSKIFFNCGVIFATLGEHATAVAYYQRAVQLDQYLAVAYFQQGVSNFLMGDFEEALANFNDTLLYLRGNRNIDYEQLGLKFKLYSCEVLFNRGLCYVYLQQTQAGMQDLMFAAREKMVPDHSVIDEAIAEQAEGYTVFSIPVGVVYRPSEAKVKNLKSKDYLGKARLIAAQEQRHNIDPRQQAAMAARGIDDRPEGKLSYAALNLVRPDLRSRATRQQSEPPISRNIFPPTPPPETEKPDYTSGRRNSTESAASERSALQQARPSAKPLRLELGAAAFDYKSHAEKSRPAPKRSESERPVVRREYSGSWSRNGETAQREARSSDHRSKRNSGQFEVRTSSLRNRPEMQVEEDPIQVISQPTTSQSSSFSPQYHNSNHNSNHHHHHRTMSSAYRSPAMAIEEVAEDEDGDGGDDVIDSPLAFEILPPRATTTSDYPTTRHRSRSKRAPELRRIRIKVHAEDLRYIMTTPTVRFAEIELQIRHKFTLPEGSFKLKIQDDEADMVTVGDQDDWDMALAACKAAAARDAVDMGKMDLWVQEV